MDRQEKMRELIAMLDLAIEMGEELNRQWDEIGRILEEKYPTLKQAA
jgi:hypothetical protein